MENSKLVFSIKKEKEGRKRKEKEGKGTKEPQETVEAASTRKEGRKEKAISVLK